MKSVFRRLFFRYWWNLEIVVFFISEEGERFSPATVILGIYLMEALVKAIWDSEFFKVEREE